MLLKVLTKQWLEAAKKSVQIEENELSENIPLHKENFGSKEKTCINK